MEPYRSALIKARPSWVISRLALCPHPMRHLDLRDESIPGLGPTVEGGRIVAYQWIIVVLLGGIAFLLYRIALMIKLLGAQLTEEISSTLSRIEARLALMKTSERDEPEMADIENQGADSASL